jgi:hypothetical protein
MAQNAEHQNLDRKLKAEQDTERIAGTAETARQKAAVGTETVWEKAAVGKKTETETEMKMTRKRTIETGKRTAAMENIVEETHQTMVVN